MLRPTLALLALLIPQGLLASEVYVSSSSPAAQVRGVLLPASIAPSRTVSIEPFEKDTPATPVRFDLDALRPIRLEIVTLEGAVVHTLASGLWAAGQHELAWYGVDDQGDRVDDGPYTVRLTLEDELPAVALATPVR
jgi:hypothetical protein